ncbi:MAG: TIGR03013 family PEP-CTERM/XrtA system glycosyltransferase [Nitrospirae bacterium]|nr:TIGR03013 family PEP-CTERM/XrtA system glycosyltransferase [Nitrospirota bacterium]
MSFLQNAFAKKNVFLILGDIILAILAVYAGVFLRFFSEYDSGIKTLNPLMLRAVTFSVFVVLMCFFVDLYDSNKKNDKKDIFLRILVADFLVAIALGTFYYFIPYVQLGRGILFLSICFSIVLQSAWHISYVQFLKLPSVVKKVLIIGTGPLAERMGNLLLSSNNGHALAGYFNCLGEPVHVPPDYVIGNGEGLSDIVRKEKVQKIVVSLSERRGTFPVREVLNCKLQGVDVVDGPSFYEQMTGKLLIENMNPSHLIFSDGFRITLVRRHIKRLFDVVLAAIGLLFSMPFLLIIPALIKLDSKGPVFFKQQRLGEGEKPFTLYKFRTMIDGAEKGTGPIWSKAGDSRITQLGRFLRKTRLDELPQLFNVIRGDMSFIGPRPERPFFVESLNKQIPYYSERHCIKPGLTGWAQVRYEYGDSIEDAIEKLRYDLYYIKYQSLTLDMLIVLDTIKVILFGRGGR